jgi:hypothetical protein
VTRSILSFAATFAMELARETLVAAGRRALGVHKLEQRVAELEAVLGQVHYVEKRGGIMQRPRPISRAS